MEFNLFIVHLFRNITLYTKQTITLILFDREALASASLNTRLPGFRVEFWNFGTMEFQEFPHANLRNG